MRLKTLGILALALVALAVPAVAQTFTFTAIPDADESRLRERFNKVADYLTEKLGVTVKYVPVKNYAASVTAFRNNQVQMAWFGGLSGVRARLLVPGSEAIAQGQEDTAFVTYFIAHSSTGLKPGDAFPEGIRGRTFTFGSKGSTSGRLMPEFYVRKHLGPPEQVFRRVGFSGDHSRTLALVQSGAYEMGALNYQVWEVEKKQGKVDPAKVAVIWKTPPYPDYQWTIRGDVDRRFGAGFKEKVKATLLGIERKDILEAFPRSRFVPASNGDYQAILDTGKAIGILD